MSIDRDSPSVQTYLCLLQGVISRMARNSAACKTWCITLVAAISALGVGAEQSAVIPLALLPITVFCLLDGYYLSLERDFRYMYDTFVDRLQGDTSGEYELFKLKPPHGWKHRSRVGFAALSSTSILWFYVTLAMAMVAVYLITGSPDESGLLSNPNSAG